MPFKYNYPPDDELVELFVVHRTYSAVSERLGIPRETLKGHVRYRPDLHRAIKAVTEGVKKQFSGRREIDRGGLSREEYQRQYNQNYRELRRKKLEALKLSDPDAYEKHCEHQRRRWREKQRRYKERKPEKVRQWRRQFAEANPDYQKQKYWSKPEYFRAYSSLNAAKRRSEAPYTKESIEYMQIIKNDPCVYCGGEADTVDHIVPIHDGGTSEPENLAPACRHCNISKHTRSLLSFLLYRQL